MSILAKVHEAAMRTLLRVATRGITPQRIVGDDGSLYLERFHLFGWRPPEIGEPIGPGWSWLPGVMLHHFHRGDEDREVHSHPWAWALGLILVNGYIEERWANGKSVWTDFSPFGLNLLTADTWHRVHLPDGDDCWTLFVTGPKVQSWGFLDHEKAAELVTPWREFVAMKKEGVTQ